MNVGSIVPVTMVQFGVSRVMELALSADGAAPGLRHHRSVRVRPLAPRGC